MKKLLTFLTLLTLSIGVGWAATVTISYTGSTTNMDGTNQAATLGLDAQEWSVVGDKGSHTLFPGLNASGYIALYYNVNGSNTLSVSSLSGATINHITVTYTGGNYTNAYVTVGGNNVSGDFSDNSAIYLIDGTSFVIGNANTSNQQVRIRSIVIDYSTGSSVKEPIITLDPASGPYYVGDEVTATISCETADATLSYSLDNGITWQAYSGAVTIPSNVAGDVKIIAKAAKNGEEATTEKTVTFNAPIANIAAFKQLANNAEFKFAGDIVVTYVNESDTRYVWVKDASGSAVFFNTLSPVPSQGDIIKGGWKGKKTIYSGLHEITSVTGEIIQGTEDVTPAELPISQITIDNQSTYGYVRNVVITSVSGQNFYFTADGETTINGYNTYSGDEDITIPEADNSTRYDILGIVNVYSNKVQFTPIAFEAVQVAPGAEYYLVGDFGGNDWPVLPDYRFERQLNGSYVLTFDNMPNNIRFKIAKVEDGTETGRFGGTGINGQDYGIHSGHHNEIHLNGNDAFFLAAGKSTIFTLDADAMTFDVERPQLFIRGSFDGWSDNGVEMEPTADGWTYTRELAGGAGFGFVDGWNGWHGREWLIKEENLGTNIPIETSNNYTVEEPGTYTITVNSAINTLVVTKQAESETGNAYTLVETASDLEAGGEYIIVAHHSSLGYYALSTADAIQISNGNVTTTPNARMAVNDITVTNNTANAGETVTPLTLEGSTGAWMFNSDAGYLYLNGYSNYLLCGNSPGSSNGVSNAAASITIESDKTASIVFNNYPTNTATGSNVRLIQFNPNNQSGTYYPRFACYASTQAKIVYLYKKTATSNRSATPEIEPESSTIKGGLVNVTITAADGAAIYYTTDGSIPDKNNQDQLYEGPFDLWSTGGRKVVTAIAVENEKDASYPVSVTYLFTSPDAPIFGPESGTESEEAFDVTITSPDGGDIYYILDPEEDEIPNGQNDVKENGTKYQGAINISSVGEHTIYAIAELNGIKSNMVTATYTINAPAVTVNPPAFYSMSQGQLSDNAYIAVDDPFGIFNDEYELDATVYYMIDPESEPTAEQLKANGTVFDYESDGIFFTVGQHHVYAICEYEGGLSEVVSITLNVYEAGEWKLVDWDNHYRSNIFDYIIVTADHSKVIGAYENGHFNAIDCENNVIFTPDYRSATVNNDDIKIFNIESRDRENQYGLYDRFLLDTDGNYYNFGEGSTVEVGKSPIEILYEYSTGHMVLKAPWPYTGSRTLQYSEDNFSMYLDATPIVMYYRPRIMTLAELCEESKYNYMTGSDEFTIKDELVAIDCTQNDGHVLLWCKDQGNASVEKTTNPDPENIEDYMRANHFFNQDWDQSNWIMVAFENANYNEVKNYIGYHIAAGTLKGYVNISRQGHTLYTTATELELAGDVTTEFTPNLYCPANFLKENHNGNATGHGNYSYKKYFFMNPKIEEICDITFAVWYVDDWGWGYFTLPAPSATANITDIHGAFSVIWDYNIYGEQTDNLVVGQVYKLHAFVREPQMVTKDGETVEPQTGVYPGPYNVYPLDFDPEENIITGIETVNMFAGNGEVKSIKYINVAGIESATPFQGMNIVVIEYTNGTRTTTKMLKK